jgi:hypothetical protein
VIRNTAKLQVYGSIYWQPTTFYNVFLLISLIISSCRVWHINVQLPLILRACTVGTGGPFPETKAWPGHDADHAPQSSAEVENE